MTNSDAPVNQTALQLIAVPLNSFLMGICFEACTIGFFTSGARLLDILYAKKKTESPFLTLLIVMFNLGAMISLVVSVLTWIPLSETTCVPVDFLSNIAWHFYFIVFDVFILYKSYIVTDKNAIYLWIASLSFLYRISWTIPDLMWTGGTWDPATETCIYNYNALTGFHYTIADILCDVVATAGAVTMFMKPENRSLEFRSLWFQLMKENGTVFPGMHFLLTC
ncbi:hypothetical protein BCR33DRAFT_739723 [Rhizoclosmatium globosum]|uniref:G-protein coupled receptors family 1 profile domain-containing protein n=1 Tax=Rhizoclosmatium globosum TaxID=329046 RepID=A0A1Y2C3X3_9FUNG|nr:hypothetical protein BCR33DRAFT_739723 [Rhizoclosmatium globosum]|eukprot:ORY41742.1 hypothetical protein BCR33DRAFT_739723 [Rhizoclosmatium globosum]